MTIPFVKMHGAANDFVVVDHRAPLLPAKPARLIARLCDRRRGVGADGVLLLEADAEFDFRMSYFNRDGGRAEFCGNGARCIARFALERGIGRAGEVRFRSDAGVHRARRDGSGISVEFGRVAPGRSVRLEAAGRTFQGWLVAPGVPHLVVPIAPLGLADVAAVPLTDWAPPLRTHAGVGPGGANVDFVATLASGRIAMRTWERGVEGETLACGTGAIASAAWAVAHGAAAPITIRTAGGDDLVVSFAGSGGGWEATLTGPAEVAFTGEWRDVDEAR